MTSHLLFLLLLCSPWPCISITIAEYRYFRFNCLEVADTGTAGYWFLQALAFIKEDGSAIDTTNVLECGSPPCCMQDTARSDDYKCHRLFDPWDAENVDLYESTPGVLTGWVMIDFGTSQRISAYRLMPYVRGYASNKPKSWTLTGSNDNSNWDIVSTVTNYDWSPNRHQELQVTLPQSLVTPQWPSPASLPASAPTKPCSPDDNCQGCRDGAFAVLGNGTDKIVDGGGYCIVNADNVCVDVYERGLCSSDDSACPADAHTSVEPHYLQPAWYQVCQGTGNKVVMGPDGCKGRGGVAAGMCAASR